MRSRPRKGCGGKKLEKTSARPNLQQMCVAPLLWAFLGAGSLSHLVGAAYSAEPGWLWSSECREGPHHRMGDGGGVATLL